MKKFAVVVALTLSTAAAAQEPDPRADIHATLGFVPTFLEGLPREQLGPYWETAKAIEMSKDTALPGRVKELIGLGVAAQIPCDYCVYFHTEIAKLGGADERQIAEAVGMASFTRFASTILNGNAVDPSRFRKDLAGIVKFARKGAGKPAPLSSLTTAEAVRRDMKATIGLVPGFAEAIPEGVLPGYWKQARAIELSNATALSGKEKELIGLGVASQIPCGYCVTFHTEAARLHGATTREIREAIAMAALTRQGSTIINGRRVDPATFRKDVDRIVATARATASK